MFILLVLAFIIANPIFFYKKSTSNFLKADVSKLEAHVHYFSDLNPGRGYGHDESLNQAAQHIENVFTQYCPSVRRQTYTVEGKEFSNIICSFNTGAADRIIVGAHYDSYNSLPGADDNASGVAGLLELARMLQINTTADSTQTPIDLVAYTLEEPPFFRSDNMGSFRHAAQLRNEGANLKVAIILEMIGYYSDDEDTQNLPMSILKPLYPDKGDFITVIGKFGQGAVLREIKTKMLEVATIDVRSFSGPTFIETIDFSDHRSFWLHEYPAVLITDTSFYRNNNYHTENDLPSTLDYSRMADVVNGVYWAVANI